MPDLISQNFYLNPDVVHLARQLLGKIITTKINGQTTSGVIVETEAYRGPDDRGCHAYGGRLTERTKTMYCAGGAAYVYICYGMHPMFNVVSGPQGDAHAILIRGIKPIEGIEIMTTRRNQKQPGPIVANGPGKLAIALGITKGMDGTTLYHDRSPIQISEGPQYINDDQIVTGLRVGMSVHVGPCSYRPWRFYIRDNKWVSKPLNVSYNF